MLKIQPVILSGGNGLRLYPLSTAKIPKQLITIGDQGTLLEITTKRIIRLLKECKRNGYETLDPFFIMHRDHQLPLSLHNYKENVLYEDFANDTAVAILRGCLSLKEKINENVILLVLPSDHYIDNVDTFIYDIAEGIKQVNEDNIVLYGVEPTAPETKYGYIIPTSNGIKFQEKPDSITAFELIKQGSMWNSGLFTATLNTIHKLLYDNKYNIIDWIHNPRQGKAVSFDVAVLQNYDKLYVHRTLIWTWKDIGTFDSFTSIPEVKAEMKDSSTIIKECNNVNVLNRSPGNIVVIGCSDLFVVRNGNDLLVMSSKGDYNNQLKEIAGKLS